MTHATDMGEGRLGAAAMAAADWVARLGGDPAEADWLAFEAWLRAAPDHRAAYDQALALWLEMDLQAGPLSEALDEAILDCEPASVSRAKSRGRGLWWSASMMTVAVAALAVTVLRPEKPATPDVYATAKGERRTVALSDGTRVALNTASSITVRMSGGARQIVLAQGEAAFQVVHDPQRPFTVEVGDRMLRDIGTDFDVQRIDGTVTVTVLQGIVAVQRHDGDPRSLSLTAGSRWSHREGAADALVQVADTEQAFAWRAGRLIYRDQPLAAVAADLDRYGPDQIKVSGGAGDLRFSGVLTIDNQAAMVNRLTGLLPLASARKDGVITLSALHSER